ncbi:MAG TPA: MFS transporter [Bryobacteraceae bacterium]|jgi:MFS family permease|nr:MFS transporter [Bryobacteraceae bacterium]
MSSTPAPLTFREVFKIAALRRLWLAQLVSVCGDFLAIYAIFAVVSFRMHASANAVSLVLVFYLLPLAIVSPLAGVFVDSWNVKRTMIASDLTRAVLFLLLLFAHSLWQIYAILMAASTVSSFFLPAQTITLRTVVPLTGLTSANALIQQAFYMMQIISPAISGLLVSAFGPNSCFWIDAATFVFSAGMISTLTIPHQPAAALKTVRSVASEIGVGLKFIFTHPSISFVIISMAAGMFAIRCFGALLAVYVRDVLRGSTSLFGVLGSLIGVGMIVGTQLVRRAVRGRSNSHIVTGGLATVGFSIALIAFFGTTPAAVAGILMLGFFLAFIVVPAQVLMQEHTPKNMLGRVTGSMVSVLIASQVLGMLFAGEMATTVGIRNVYYGSAALLFLLAGAGYYWLSRDTAQAPAAAA